MKNWKILGFLAALVVCLSVQGQTNNAPLLGVDAKKIIAFDAGALCLDLQMSVTNDAPVGTMTVTAQTEGGASITDAHTKNGEMVGLPVYSADKTSCTIRFRSADNYHITVQITISKPATVTLSGANIEATKSFEVRTADPSQ